MNAVGHGDSFYCKPIISPHDLPNYQGNIALNKKASQSSVCSYSKEEDACGAINGRKTGGYGFHTDAQNNPWWKVDLLDKHPLNEIRIFNRLDAARERSRTLQIYLSLDDYNWELVHDQAGRKFGGIDGRPLRVILNKRYARYVRIQLNGFSYLHLDQIGVY
jgi:hypothetical protein